jgi:hypothetical protein
MAAMATRVTTTLIDDLDPTQTADETVRFALDGAEYEIDLSKAHADDMREALREFVRAGRRLSRSGQPLRPSAKPVSVDPAAVRAWAASNGITVSPRGRVSSSVVEQFRAAMG